MMPFNENYLTGGQYLVTGASSGIGRATAERIAAAGGRVIAAGRDTQRLASLLESLPGTGHVGSECSLVDADATADWVKSLVERHGAFHGVFHAAGIELIRPARMTKQAQVNEVFGSAVFAGFGIARGMAGRGALVDGSSLVFMSSVAGSSGQVGMSAYCAAKAALDGMVRSLACEFAPRKIRVNSIAAGAVQTAMHERLMKGAVTDVVAAYENSHLLGFGEPADVANAALFLLGDAGRWVTGTTMIVDGGYLCK